MRPFLLVLAAIASFLVLWIGGAQLGVAIHGHENNIIIMYGVVGMVLGVGAGFRIMRKL